MSDSSVSGSSQSGSSINASSLSRRSRSDRKKIQKPIRIIMEVSPKLVNMFAVLVEFFAKREIAPSMSRQPLEHYCNMQAVHAAKEYIQRLKQQTLNHQDMRDMTENLLKLHAKVVTIQPEVAVAYGNCIRRMIVIMTDITVALEQVAKAKLTNWNQIILLIDNRNKHCAESNPRPFTDYIPSVLHFREVKLLGAGGFGAVYKVYYKPANLVMSLKIIPSDRFKQSFQAAADKIVASIISNDFLVHYYSCFATQEAFITLMEYIPGVDLNRVLSRVGVVDQNLAQLIAIQMFIAIEHLHLRGFIHRDIKVQNVLIMPAGRIKVIDFDTNKCCMGHFIKRILPAFFRRTSGEFWDNETAGTLVYMPPETLLKQPYGRAVDWWSLGVTCYKLTTGVLPFRSKKQDELIELIVKSRPQWPDEGTTATPECRDFVERLLHKNPQKRFGSRLYNEFRKHPYFENVDWNHIRTQKHLYEVPNIREAMSGKADDTTTMVSPEASDGSKKRATLRVENLTDQDKKSQLPLMTFTSMPFRRLLLTVFNSRQPIQASPDDLFQTEDASEEIQYETKKGDDEMSNAPSARKLETFKVILTRSKILWFFKYKSFGFKYEIINGLNNKKALFISRIDSNSPASASHLRHGDIVIGINNVALASQTEQNITKMLTKAGSEITLIACSQNIYRLLGQEHQRDLLMRQCQAKEAVLMANKAGRSCCRKNVKDPVQIDTVRNLTRNENLHIVRNLSPQAQVVHGQVLTADVITHINGIKVGQKSNQEILNSLNSQGVQLTVLCTSPLRLLDQSISKTRSRSSTVSSMNSSNISQSRG